jgi:glycosyltransferase involved in cell wall biosynthesis
MKPLRLLAIIEARTITGPAKNLLDFAAASTALGVETQIATFVRGEETNLFVDTARIRGISIHPIAEKNQYDPSAVRSLAELVSRLAPDVLQTHAVKSHFLVRRAHLPGRVPWVAFHHGYTWTSRRTRLYNLLDRWSLHRAAKVLTVSQPFKTELQEKGVAGDRIEIIHNAIRADWAAVARQPENSAALRAGLKIAPDRKVILIVGRLSREKDHLTLLEAVHRLPGSVSPHLVIVGDGPERQSVEERIQKLGLSDSVTLTGQQNSAEPYYGIANLAVLSSWTEGSPNALLEAMAAGVPIVATNVGGIPEIVTSGESALLIDPGQPGPLAESIERLLKDRELASRLASRGEELIRERHTPEQRTRRLVEIYRRIARPGATEQEWR